MNNGHDTSSEALANLGDIGTEISRVESSAVATLARSEVETQVDCAHRYPRSIKTFLSEAITLATLTRSVAESCIYALPRGGKVISGPSARLAEIMASAYGNLHIGSRILDVEEKEVVAQGVAWDLQKNVKVSIEARRRITNKFGKRYDDDMITVTGAAAASIARRNAIFRVVPRSYVDMVYAKVREVAVGNASTLAARRDEVVARLQKIGVPLERVFGRVGKKAIEDVGLEELEVLIGLGTAVKNGEQAIDAAFPPAAGGAPVATKALEKEILDEANADGELPHTPKPEPAHRDVKPANVQQSAAAASLPVSYPPKAKRGKAVEAPNEAPPCAECGNPVDFSKGGVTVSGKPMHDDCAALGSPKKED